MDFLSAKEYIDGLNRFGSVLGLSNIRKLLELLGNPEKALRVIHVAGTNGKGSTITYIESILREASYTTAKYTSPVVFEYLEKYQISGKNIGEEDFVRAVIKVKAALKELNERDIYPTVFEVETAIAFLVFKEKNVDVVLLETGMGGDSDATNVLDRVLLSVITSISYDHMAFLGDTIEEIASHKAGIIKRNCPVTINGNNKAALEVIKNIADKNNSNIRVAAKADLKNKRYKAGSGEVFLGIETCLKGLYQEENIALAIESILEIRDTVDVTEENIVSGIKKAYIAGRFEKISDNPPIYIDGAHNGDAVDKLKRTLEENFKEEEKVFIMGVLADKDYEKECRSICSLAKAVITVTPNNPRALNGEKLMETANKYNNNVCYAKTLEEALEKAVSLQADMIVAFGSLSYLGRFKEICKSKNW